jgi:hypothetical protein
MKRVFLLLVLLASMLIYSSAVSLAQQPANEIDSVQISIWPDFDDPSVLVLLTGQLPEGVALPAEVSIPVPNNADLNAVAFIDDQGMVSLDFEQGDGVVTFSTTNPSFRVEYYAPYEQSGAIRSYDFEWLSDFSVGELTVEVQQPANASTLTTEPQATNVYTNQMDGLVYHGLDAQAVPAGTPYRLAFTYEMSSDGLTVNPAATVPSQTSDSQAVAPTTETGINWLWVAGIVGLVALAVVGTWLASTRMSSGRKSTRPVKPKPKARDTVGSGVVYCHNCGQAADGSDSFCRNCGTELRRQ